jgi:thioredoxin-related protein
MQRLCLFVALVLLIAVPAVAEEARFEGEWKTIDPKDRTTPPPVRPSTAKLDVEAQPPANAPKLPGSLTAQAAVSFELRGKTIHVILAKSTPDVSDVDRAAIDRNGDGTFANDEVETVTLNERNQRDGTTLAGHSIALENVDLSREGATYLAYLMFYRPVDGAWSFTLYTLWYLEGTVALGDKQYIVNVVDNDQDGSFEGSEDLWLVRSTEPVKRSARAFAMSGPGEGRFFDGKRFVLKSVQGADVALEAADAEGPDPEDEAKARVRVEHMWAKRFDKEREDFVKRTSLDTSRARAKEPIRWRYITFAEAKELAAKEKKALFVDIMAFWCVWCYRMDYYTYIDAEVAKVLNEQFIAVKIIQEQDRAGDYKTVREELKARGIPAMGIWGPDGELRRMIGGWKKPEDFLTELRLGLETEKPDG